MCEQHLCFIRNDSIAAISWDAKRFPLSLLAIETLQIKCSSINSILSCQLQTRDRAACPSYVNSQESTCEELQYRINRSVRARESLDSPASLMAWRNLPIKAADNENCKRIHGSARKWISDLRFLCWCLGVLKKNLSWNFSSFPLQCTCVKLDYYMILLCCDESQSSSSLLHPSKEIEWRLHVFSMPQ